MANPDAKAGTITNFQLTQAGGSSLTDITQYITDIRPTYTGNRINVSTMGNASQRFISGQLENGYELEGVYDKTIDGIMMALKGGTAGSIQYAPGGTAAGEAKHTSLASVTGYQPPSTVEGAVLWTASLACDGNVTRGTF